MPMAALLSVLPCATAAAQSPARVRAAGPATAVQPQAAPGPTRCDPCHDPR